MTDAPRFSVSGYRDLLDGFMRRHFVVGPLSEVKARARAVALRHDIDAHVEGVEVIGGVEAEVGAASTWYVPVGLLFNPAYPPNRERLRALYFTGHKIGLHYDLGDYPSGRKEFVSRMGRELEVLRGMLDVPVSSVAAHRPTAAGVADQGVRAAKLLGVEHPYAWDAEYVSDSCRHWRASAVDTLEHLPQHLILNTHHEHWLGDPDDDHLAYYNYTLQPRIVEPSHAYAQDIWNGWRAHETYAEACGASPDRA